MLFRILRTALLFCLPALFMPALQAQYLRVYFPDIEQGSSTVIVSPTGQAMLVDGGSGIRASDDDIVAFVRHLLDTGVVSSLEYVVATHYDEDHIGRLEDVLNSGLLSPTGITFDRGEFGGVPSTFAYSDYSFAASQHNRTTITPTTSIDLGGGVLVHCLVVNGELPDGSAVDISGSNQFENSASVGLLVQYGDFDFWLAGDLTGNLAENVSDVESAVAPFLGDVDVYTFHHHGSRTSSTTSFLSVIRAETGLNQNSVDNNFGHPNSEVVTGFLNTPDSFGNTPLFFQQNPGDPTDSRSDDGLAAGIADPDDVDDVVGLPGTITLISDGFSYQLAGGLIAPVVRPSDSGPGTIGDFPPAVLLVERQPLVPQATETVTVEADVWDEGAVSVELKYLLNDIPQSPIPMSPAPGSGRYTADIPSQPDGTLVVYEVTAQDAWGQVTRSRPSGYYSGTTPISAIRVNDADGVLESIGYSVRVEGNLTVEPGIFHPFVSQIYVQDDAGDGVQVFNGSLLPLVRGDRVEFVGEIEQFAAQTEVNISENFGNYGHTFLSAGTPPAPVVVTVSQIDESMEGRLVRINGVQVVSGEIAPTGNSNLTISDDGGVSTTTLRIDGDTDIPGANTPTGAFDIVGVASQFDSTFPYLSGFQVLPRERADLISDEVNLPVLLINEVHTDPDPAAGDANGDGQVSSTRDEFIELVNTTSSALDISGFMVSDAVKVRHVFEAGTVVPAREAVVVFAGGAPTGSFGNASAYGLVSTASSGTLGFNNGGDTITVADAAGGVIQSISYGSEGGQNQSLVRDPDVTNTPFVLHSTASISGGSLYSPGARSDGSPFTVAPGTLLITEVLYDASGADDGLEWVELYNAGDFPIDLAGLSLGNGGSDYTSSLVQLSGSVGAGQTFVVGGPTSNSSNGSPSFNQAVNFSPDFQNGGTTADGVALFNVPAAQVTASTVPIDAVVYGDSNDNGLIDETGSANPPEVADAPSGSSIERLDLAGNWQVQSNPNPNAFGGSSNQPPVADPQSVSTDQDTPVEITLTGSDPDGDPITYQVQTQPSNGVLSGTAPDLTYTPNAGFSGSDSFTFIVNDGLADSQPATVSITVNAVGGLVLSEVFYDASGSDDGLEWVELYNSSGSPIDLSGYSLGNGGSDYTYSQVQLSGTIGAQQTFVVGGPTSNGSNGNPAFDLVVNFSPDFQNSGSTADGVALFNLPASQVGAATVPIDAVVYGGSNSSGLIDETGAANAPEVGDASTGSSIERTDLAGAWQIQSVPTPNQTPLAPPAP